MKNNIREILKSVSDGDKDAFHKLEELAEAGEPQALRELAIIFRDGKFGIQASGIKAVEYFTKEIERDKGKSLDEIADRYLKNSCGNDMNDANEYLGDLSEICNVYTFQNIAQIFLEGRVGLKSDGQRALEYFFKAEEALDNAINFTKTFVALNRPNVFRRIFRWGRKCKKNICRQIAEIFLEGRGGIPVDGYKAIEHFDKASSFDKVAEIYRYGKAGVKINPQKAVEYLLRYVDEICRNHKSANTADNVDSFIDDLNRAEAFRGIGEIYLTLDDGERALEYFLKADEYGDEWAHISIAQLYREGKGNLKPDGINKNFWRYNIMTEEKNNLTITRNENGQISIQGDEAIVKKISIVIGEYLLTDGEMTEKKLDTLVDIAEDLYNCGNCSPEHLTAAKKFLKAIEGYSYPRAMNVLAWIQKNPLISEAMELRAATVGDPPTVENFLEEYTAQATYWQKKIAEAEGKTFDGDAPTDEEISDSNRLRFFNVYKRAFDGNLDDMKTCLEFCREEIAYWSNR